MCAREPTHAVRALVCFGTSDREEAASLNKKYEKTEDDLKALQSVGQVTKGIMRPAPTLAISSYSAPHRLSTPRLRVPP